MRNPFETEQLLKALSNYPFAKGDLPGHKFHGNQYVTFSANDLSDALQALPVATDNIVEGEQGISLDLARGQEQVGALRDIAGRHDAIANDHLRTIRDLENLIALHQEAADTHTRASETIGRLANDRELYQTETGVQRTLASNPDLTREQVIADNAFRTGFYEPDYHLTDATIASQQAADATNTANGAPYKTLNTTTE